MIVSSELFESYVRGQARLAPAVALVVASAGRAASRISLSGWDYREFRVWPERLNLFMPLPG
jgi:hypothetical protein